MTETKKYEVAIFDGNPNQTSGTRWPQSYAIDSLDDLQSTLDEAAAEASCCPDYEVGDKLWYIVFEGDHAMQQGSFVVVD